MRAINLLPPEQRAGSARGAGDLRLNPLHGIAGAGAVVVLVLLAMWGMARQDASEAREAEAEAVARAASTQVEVNRLQPVVDLDRRRASRETAVLSLAAGRTDWAAVLQSVAGALPAQVGVTKLSASAAGAASNGVPAGLEGSGSVVLTGCADTQPRVAQTLRRLRALPQAADVALTQTAKTRRASGSGGADCDGVAMDAALGLAPTVLLDADATPAEPAAADPAGDPTTTASTGASR